ncbi:porin [Klebsiella pneumoniae subsp. pneumoniae]|nr:porin [Klebsiella pneumoniae subsp. pneumoniae]
MAIRPTCVSVLKAKRRITDDLTGYGRWESEFSGNKTESDSSQKTRLAFAGVKLKNYGSFDYGRNLGALYDVEAWTDMFPEFGGDSSAQTDNFMTKRASGWRPTATPTSSVWWMALDLTLQYQGKNEGREAKKQNGDGVGTSLSYDFGGSDFAVSAAYHQLRPYQRSEPAGPRPGFESGSLGDRPEI